MPWFWDGASFSAIARGPRSNCIQGQGRHDMSTLPRTCRAKLPPCSRHQSVQHFLLQSYCHYLRSISACHCSPPQPQLNDASIHEFHGGARSTASLSPVHHHRHLHNQHHHRAAYYTLPAQERRDTSYPPRSFPPQLAISIRELASASPPWGPGTIQLIC